jgi:hypothetical protein
MQKSPDQSKQHIGKLLRALTGIILIETWFVCVCRAIVFVIESYSVYAETRSVHAWNDLAYGRLILFSDLLCAGIGLGALWFAGRSQRGGIAWIPILASAASGILVVAREPEEVIVMIPTLTVFYALALCISSVLLASGILGCSKLKLVLLK